MNKKKNSDKKKIAYIIIMVLLFIVFTISMIEFVSIIEGYWKANNEYEDIRKHMKATENSIEETLNTTESEETNIEEDKTIVIPDIPEKDDSYYQNVINQFQNSSATSNITIPDFDYLRTINSNIVGWIQIPDTPIDYPIVQGSDNEFYLSHTVNGTESTTGAIFLDAGIDDGLNDKNPVIFGHNLKSGAMFSRLNRYVTRIGFWESHKYIYVTTPEETRIYFVFSVYQTQGDITVAYGFSDGDTFVDYCNGLIAKSAIDAGYLIKSDDSIITLSTCANNRTDRIIVHGVRIE